MTVWGLVLKFLLPGSVLYFFLLLLLQVEFLQSWLPSITSFLPYFIFLSGLYIGWKFSRSRLIFVLLVLTIADHTLQTLTFQFTAGVNIDLIVFNIISFILPLNILIIALLRERGIFTWQGIWRLSLICIQPFIIYTLVKFRYLVFFSFLDWEFLKSNWFQQADIPQLSMLIFIITAIFLVVNYILRKDMIESGLFWVLLCVFGALVEKGSPASASAYLSTGGLILILSSLKYSHKVTSRDELTGLPTRRSMSDTFLKLPARYSIAIVDIDNLKTYNDEFGHETGDQILRMVASRALEVAGRGKIFRYGGEEFCIILAEKSANETRVLMEQLRRKIAGRFFVVRSGKRPLSKPKVLDHAPRSDEKIKVTVSIGIAERNENLREPEDVIKAAEEALQQAKKAGRDRLLIHGTLHAWET